MKNTFVKAVFVTVLGLSFFSSYIFAQTQKTEKYTINGITFTVVHKALNTENSYIELFKGKKKLLKHTIWESGGDCNSESIEMGSFKVTNSSLILYTFWCKAGDAPVSPFGAREQVYKFDNGSLHLINSRLYIECIKEGYKMYPFSENDVPADSPHLKREILALKGQKYLSRTPVTKEEKNYYQLYIELMGEWYNAKFVDRDKFDDLLNDIRLVFKEELKEIDKKWEYLKQSSFGVKM